MAYFHGIRPEVVRRIYRKVRLVNPRRPVIFLTLADLIKFKNAESMRMPSRPGEFQPARTRSATEKILGAHLAVSLDRDLFALRHRFIVRFSCKGLKTLNNLIPSLRLLGNQAAQLPTQIVAR